MINRNAIFKGGIRPYMYCLPIAKREEHRLALREAATSGNPRFFLGTDTAPHLTPLKENACGCAGIFNSPNTLACLAQLFEEEGKLENLEAFTSINGARFYGLPENKKTITLVRGEPDWPKEVAVPELGETIQVFEPPVSVGWRVQED